MGPLQGPAGMARHTEQRSLPYRDEKRGHRAPRPHTAAGGPPETLPQRTRGASGTGWPQSASRTAGSRDDLTPHFTLLDYVRLEGAELDGETGFPPPPEVLDRVLDGLRKLG